MAYERQYYTNGDVLDARQMNHMETGIKENSDNIDKLSEDIATKASAIKEKASGEVIVVTDSDEQKPLELAIYGKSEQNGEPTLENRVEIVNCGKYDEASGKYAVEVKCTGKNLIDVKNVGTVNVPNSTNVRSGFIFDKKGTYTISIFGDFKPDYLYYFLFKNGAWGSQNFLRINSNNTVTFTLNENEKILTHLSGNYTFSEIVENFQLECGSVATAYEPYKETTATALLPQPLRKEDEAYWNGGSKVRVDRNTIDYKPIISTVEEITDLDGNPAYRLTCKLSQLAKIKEVSSNCFSLSNNWLQVNCIIMSGSFDMIYIVIPKEELTGASVETAQNWINSHGVVCEYQIAEPTTEEIDLSLDGLSMFYPTTILSNDCNANMEVTYIADTKAYIDKKFAELATAMV